MPFGPELDIIHKVIENACSEAAVTFVRGDHAEGQDVIRSIWDEIGLGTHTVVDLTGFNLNVCLELGMADTLGRPTLLIGQAGTEKLLNKFVPSLAKRRLNKYRVEDPLRDRRFAAALGSFLVPALDARQE